MVNLPDFFTSFVATAAKLSSTFLTADFDIATAPFIAVAFIASAFARGAIAYWQGWA